MGGWVEEKEAVGIIYSFLSCSAAASTHPPTHPPNPSVQQLVRTASSSSIFPIHPSTHSPTHPLTRRCLMPDWAGVRYFFMLLGRRPGSLPTKTPSSPGPMSFRAGGR